MLVQELLLLILMSREVCNYDEKKYRNFITRKPEVLTLIFNLHEYTVKCRYGNAVF